MLDANGITICPVCGDFSQRDDNLCQYCHDSDKTRTCQTLVPLIRRLDSNADLDAIQHSPHELAKLYSYLETESWGCSYLRDRLTELQHGS